MSTRVTDLEIAQLITELYNAIDSFKFTPVSLSRAGACMRKEHEGRIGEHNCRYDRSRRAVAHLLRKSRTK